MMHLDTKKESQHRITYGEKIVIRVKWKSEPNNVNWNELELWGKKFRADDECYQMSTVENLGTREILSPGWKSDKTTNLKHTWWW